MNNRKRWQNQLSVMRKMGGGKTTSPTVHSPCRIKVIKSFSPFNSDEMKRARMSSFTQIFYPPRSLLTLAYSTRNNRPTIIRIWDIYEGRCLIEKEFDNDHYSFIHNLVKWGRDMFATTSRRGVCFYRFQKQKVEFVKRMKVSFLSRGSASKLLRLSSDRYVLIVKKESYQYIGFRSSRHAEACPEGLLYAFLLSFKKAQVLRKVGLNSSTACADLEIAKSILFKNNMYILDSKSNRFYLLDVMQNEVKVLFDADFESSLQGEDRIVSFKNSFYGELVAISSAPFACVSVFSPSSSSPRYVIHTKGSITTLCDLTSDYLVVGEERGRMEIFHFGRRYEDGYVCVHGHCFTSSKAPEGSNVGGGNVKDIKLMGLLVEENMVGLSIAFSGSVSVIQVSGLASLKEVERKRRERMKRYPVEDLRERFEFLLEIIKEEEERDVVRINLLRDSVLLFRSFF